MLEVMNRRYYQVRGLEDLRSARSGGRPVLTGQFELGGQTFYLISTVAEHGADLARRAGRGDAAGRQVPDPAQPGRRLYRLAGRPEIRTPSPPNWQAVRRYETFGRRPPGHRDRGVQRGRRTCCTSPTGPAADGPTEERVIRGMHPLTGQRLDLWRLKNFNGTRMPAAEDTYLFHLVAPNNPADERLVALAEVRDVTPVRDADGARDRRSRSPSGCWPPAWTASDGCRPGPRRKPRLDNNAIFLHVWPPIQLPLSDLGRFAQHTAPLSVGTGL